MYLVTKQWHMYIWRQECYMSEIWCFLLFYDWIGLVKILKKYDKRTGALLRLPFIQKVLQQPFFTTDLLYKLVKECERMLDHLFPVKEIPSATVVADEHEPSTSTTNNGAAPATSENKILLRGPKELAEIEYMESLYMKSTLSALRVLKEIRSGSSTVSVFSLPPLQGNGLEDPWNKVPILEEVAKWSCIFPLAFAVSSFHTTSFVSVFFLLKSCIVMHVLHYLLTEL